MRKAFPPLLTLASVFMLLASAAFAQSGMRITLTTSAQQFDASPQPDPAPGRAKRLLPASRSTLTASVALTNLSRQPATMTYDGETASMARFLFQVTDKAGNIKWRSEPVELSVGARSNIAINFAPRATWRRTVQIPLRDQAGTWWPSGRYRLEVRAGTADIAATTFFDVTSSEIPVESGITGQVLLQRRVSIEGVNSFELSPLPATLVVREVLPWNEYTRQPFTWTGETDSQGNYRIVTPPGTFTVEASNPGIVLSLGGAIVPSAFVFGDGTLLGRDVVVPRGQFTTKNFVIAGDYQRIPSVSEVQVVWGASGTGYTLTIRATGTTPTGGYRNPRLRLIPASVTSGPARYEFLLDPPLPGSLVTQAVTSYTATAEIQFGEVVLSTPSYVEVIAAGNTIQQSSYLAPATLLESR